MSEQTHEEVLRYKVEVDFAEVERKSAAAAKRINRKMRGASQSGGGGRSDAAGPSASSGRPAPSAHVQGLRDARAAELRARRAASRAGAGNAGGGNASPRGAGGGGTGGRAAAQAFQQIFGKRFPGVAKAVGAMGGAAGRVAGAAGGGGGGMVGRMLGAAGGGGGIAGIAGAAGIAGLVVMAVKNALGAVKLMGQGVGQSATAMADGDASGFMKGGVKYARGVAKGAGGPIMGPIFSKLIGVAEGFIDFFDGLVGKLGKFSPMISGMMAQAQLKQQMLQMRMAKATEPAMAAWMKMKSKVTDIMGKLAPLFRPLAKFAGGILDKITTALDWFGKGIDLAIGGLKNLTAAFVVAKSFLNPFERTKSFKEARAEVDKDWGSGGDLDADARKHNQGFINSMLRMGAGGAGNGRGASGMMGVGGIGMGGGPGGPFAGGRFGAAIASRNPANGRSFGAPGRPGGMPAMGADTRADQRRRGVYGGLSVPGAFAGAWMASQNDPDGSKAHRRQFDRETAARNNDRHMVRRPGGGFHWANGAGKQVVRNDKGNWVEKGAGGSGSTPTGPQALNYPSSLPAPNFPEIKQKVEFNLQMKLANERAIHESLHQVRDELLKGLNAAGDEARLMASGWGGGMATLMG